LAKETFKQLLKNEYFKTAIMIILIIVVVFGFWYGSQLILNTQYPALAVASGSMCTLSGSDCNGWSHPFSPTLHIGDLIVVQGVDPKEIKAAHSDGDIIVFRKPDSDELIVHRAIANETRGGKIYFQTKGDGNLGPDSLYPNIPQDRVVGKVIMRIPWVGHIALFLHNSSGIFIIIVLIIILVIVEFVIPAFTGKEAKAEQKEDVEKTFEAKAL